MDKRVVMAAGLSVLILVIWGMLFAPAPPIPTTDPIDAPAGSPRESREATLPARPEPDVAPPSDPVAQAMQAEPVEATSVERFTFANDVIAVELTNQGATATSWKLIARYHTFEGEALELLPHYVDQEPRFLQIDLENDDLEDEINSALHQVERETVPAGNGLPPGQRFRFRWADGRGVEVHKTLTFREGNSWPVDVDVDVTDRGRALPARVILGPGFGAQDPNAKRSNYYFQDQLVWKPAGARVSRLKPRKVVKQPGALPPAMRWIGLEDQYFAALLVPDRSEADAAWSSIELAVPPTPDAEAAEPELRPVVSVGLPGGRGTLFLGPKDYRLLENLGQEMEQVVWFATNPFLAWFARFIFFMLIWIHDHTVANYGVAIMLSTLLVRLVLFPVNQYSMVSMKRTQMQMQKLQPKIKAIRNKHKKKDAETRAKVNQEMMDLYKREGVNPMGGLSGCLPLLLQFPVLIGFYNMLTVAIQLRGAPFFLWIQDLSRPDPMWIMPVLMGVTMFLQQKMAMSKIKDPQQMQQQKIMMFMPLMFTYICFQMPSGLVLYWFVNNVLGIGQQYLVNRQTSRLETATQKA